MEIGDYILATVIFSALILCTMGLFGEFNKTNPGFIDDPDLYNDFNTTFNNYDEIESQTSELRGQLQNSTIDNSQAFGAITSLFNTGYLGLKYILTSFTAMNGVFLGLSKVLGIPDWVGAILILLVTVLIIFGIYKVLFRVSF
jgi:hypothetical protein